jgi:hypothetical protein
MRQLLRLVGIVGGVVMLSMLVASSTVAAKGGSDTAFFVGQKTCALHATPPLFTCVMTASNVPLLQGATVKYISVPAIFPDPMRIDSDVVLTTAAAAGAQQSIANGTARFTSVPALVCALTKMGRTRSPVSEARGWSAQSCRTCSRSSVSTRSAGTTTEQADSSATGGNPPLRGRVSARWLPFGAGTNEGPIPVDRPFA